MLWHPFPWETGLEVKVVVRVDGDGEVQAVARRSGREVSPSWGPNQHSRSSFQRPGDEWGMAFTLPAAGCWQIEIVRDDGSASLWVPVVAAGEVAS